MRKLLLFAEQGFTVTSLIVYTGAILTLVISGGAQQNEFLEYDSSLIRIINLLIYIVTFLLLGLRWQKTLEILSQDKWILPLILLASVSILWSFERAATLKDSITLIGSSSFGIYLASRYTLKQQLQLLSCTFGIIAVLSLIFVILLPNYGLMGGVHTGKWRGVFTHKNGLGGNMVLSSISFLLLAYQTQKYKWLFWGGLSLSILLLLRAVSTAALVNLSILIAVFFLFHLVRLPYLFMLPALTFLASLGQCLYFWVFNNTEFIFAALGKDTTLTGRTELWPLVIEMISKQPWLGYGYSGFWHGWDSEAAYIWRASGWTPTHPHNGFLALCLNLGLLGLGLFLMGFLHSYRRALTWVRLTRTSTDMWPLIHMTYLIIVNLTESVLMKSNSMNWILYVTASLSLLKIRITEPESMLTKQLEES